jgi:hypothetical protein
MFRSYETLIEYLETERSVYNDMIECLEDFERGKSSIDLKNIEKLLSILEKNDVRIADERTAKRTIQSSIFLHTILSDLNYLVTNSTLNDRTKEVWINKLNSLLDRTKKLIDNYYERYGYLPDKFRFWYYWYYTDRGKYKFLPYYPESYYYDLYPPKIKKLSNSESIWQNVTKGKVDKESSLFVPRSFLCLDQSQYDEYMLLKLHDELQGKEHKTTLSDEKDNRLYQISDYIIKTSKKVFER